jgi:hypothetical protein
MIQNHEEDGAAGMQGVSIFQLRTQNEDAYTPSRSPLCLLFIVQTHYATKTPFMTLWIGQCLFSHPS